MYAGDCQNEEFWAIVAASYSIEEYAEMIRYALADIAIYESVQ
jgi:hypothetical protein